LMVDKLPGRKSGQYDYAAPLELKPFCPIT
jgi:hypothetical protein